MRYIILLEGSDAMLCKDGKFRSMGGFGSYSQCFKVYKVKVRALNKTKSMNAMWEYCKNPTRAYLIGLTDDVSINACAQIHRETTEGCELGFHRIETLTKDEFRVEL